MWVNRSVNESSRRQLQMNCNQREVGEVERGVQRVSMNYDGFLRINTTCDYYV